MSTRSVPTHEALALQLQRLGVDCIFGLMSDEIAMLVAAIDGAGTPGVSNPVARSTGASRS